MEGNEIANILARSTTQEGTAAPLAPVWVASGALHRWEATSLAQMRTGKCRLKAVLHVNGAEDSDLYECGQKETVPLSIPCLTAGFGRKTGEN